MADKRLFRKAFGNQSVEGGLPKHMVPLKNITDVSLNNKIHDARKLRRDGASIRAIAEALGFSSIPVCRNFLKRYGIGVHRLGHGQGLPAVQAPRGPISMQSYKAPMAKKKKPVTVAPVWQKPTQPTKEENMKVIVPNWYAEARELRASGMPLKDIAAKFNVTVSRISAMTGVNWEAHMAKEKLSVKDRKGLSIKDFISQEGKPAMSDRHFDKFQLRDPADRRNAVVIRCGKDGCNHYSVFKKHGIISPVHAANVFRNEGWAVGGGPRGDRCPQHKNGLGSVTPAPEPTVKVDPMPAIKPEPRGIPHPVPPAAVEGVRTMELRPEDRTAEQVLGIAPEQRKPAAFPVEAVKEDLATKEDLPALVMSRMDRRTIFTKLNDVYVDEATGYKSGWSDDKVAGDLGCPVSWVAAVRDEDFGPAIDLNADRLKKLTELRVQIVAKADEIRPLIKNIDTAIDKYDGEAEAFEKLMEEFKKLSAEVIR